MFDTTILDNIRTAFGESMRLFGEVNIELIFPTVGGGWNNAGSAIRQSKMRAWTSPGAVSQHRLGFKLANSVAGLYQEIGAYDGYNGVNLVYANSLLAIKIIRDGVQVASVGQSSWNVDQMRPSALNPSGITLDPTLAQTVVINVCPTGMRPIEVGFLVDGIVYWVHRFKSGNAAVNFPSHANLPLRWRAYTDTGGIAAERVLTGLDGAVLADPSERLTFSRSSNFGSASRQTPPYTTVEVVAMRMAPGAIAKATMRLTSLSILGASGGGQFNFEWIIALNPSMTGGVWASIEGSNVEYANYRNIQTLGTKIASGFGVNLMSIALEELEEMGNKTLSAGDEMSIIVTNINPAENYFWASAKWNES